MLRLLIDLKGEEKLVKTLDRLKKRLTNYREFFEDEATPAIYKRFDEIFQSEGAASGGSRWKRLKLATLAAKRRAGHRLEILRRTDRLYGAYTGQNSYGRILIHPQSLVYKNFVPYGIYHETGTKTGLPKRTVVARILAYKEFKRDLTSGLSQYLIDADQR